MALNAHMYIIYLTGALIILSLIYFQMVNIINNTSLNILHISLYAHVLLFS